MTYFAASSFFFWSFFTSAAASTSPLSSKCTEVDSSIMATAQPGGREVSPSFKTCGALRWKERKGGSR